MYSRIEANLARQSRGMDLLQELLQEEFSHLKHRDPDSATRLEFSIHELIRQLTAERLNLRAMVQSISPGATRLNELGACLEPATADAFSAMLAEMQAKEQACAIQAEKNGEMARAMLDQSRSLLEFMTKQIQPKSDPVYSARGTYGKNSKPQAALFRGAL